MPPQYSSHMVGEQFRSMAAAEMAESLQRVGEQSTELSVEERNSMSMMSRRQEAMNHKEGKTVEVPQI